MNVSFSERQRGALYVRLSSVGDWGGDEGALLARASVWEKLKLDAFRKLGSKLTPDALATKAQPFSLTRDEAEHLITTLSAGLTAGLNFSLALEFATIVRAVRKVFPTKSPEPSK